MKLTLPVPTKKVSGPGWMRFDYEPREVEVVYVTRQRTDSFNRGWRYNVAFDHPEAHPEAVRIGFGGLLVAWVRRKDHPHWSPPTFPDGANIVLMPGRTVFFSDDSGTRRFLPVYAQPNSELCNTLTNSADE